MVGFRGKEIFRGGKEMLLAASHPHNCLSFLTLLMMALDQSWNRQQQAIVKGSLKQGNDRVMPRLSLMAEIPAAATPGPFSCNKDFFFFCF